jgi:membrane protease YdiL (CAAX protease family)
LQVVTSDFSADPPDGDLGAIPEDPGPFAELDFSGPSDSPKPPRTWGPWATVGWSLLIAVVYLCVQLVVVVVAAQVTIASDPSANVAALASSGNVLAFGTLASTPVVVGLICLLARLRGYSVRDYLALIWPPGRSVLIASAGALLLAMGSDLTSYLLGRPIIPPFMVEVYRTSWLPTLVLAISVLGPIQEEVLFRGFLYKGIAATRAGPATAIIVSAVAWALLHSQYDWYGVVTIVVLGLYLGAVRYQTNSLPLTIVLHGAVNTIATLELIVKELWLT